LKNDDPRIRTLVDNPDETYGLLRETIRCSRQRLELIGQQVISWDGAVSVNGGVPTATELLGKVVLLDFTAVWCGPCIVAFPRLRRWHGEYNRDGLVIVGVTQFCGYGWDDRTKRGTQFDGISVEQEKDALGSFAVHRQLPFPILIFPTESEFHKAYRIDALPQIVLIDRRGYIRKVVAGADTELVREIETTIAERVRSP
jgi:thiol-disulfide isomerase/thioredoxin